MQKTMGDVNKGTQTVKCPVCGRVLHLYKMELTGHTQTPKEKLALHNKLVHTMGA